MPRSSGTRCGTNVTCRAELLFHLGDVTVAEHAVRGDRSVVLGEVRAVARRAAGARDAGLRVDDHAAHRVEQAGLDERQEREQRGGRIAARVGDERRAADVVAIVLGQTVRGAGRQRPASRGYQRARARIIPNAERAREIDDADAGVDERRRQLGGRVLGHREKHEVHRPSRAARC